MSLSRLARCLVHTGGTKQMFAESDPKSLPALVFQRSLLTLTPGNPTLLWPVRHPAQAERAGPVVDP